ncbi:MAG: chemotaxis protein CheW, partial [Pseudanabaenaceae cyanobacterium]
PEITPIPDSPSDIIGIANLRGKALPVIHLAKRLGISEIRCQITDNLVVINIATTLVGIVVEAVMGIIEIASGDIDRLINDFIPPLSNFLSGVGKIGDRLLPLINPNTLVRSPLEVSTISEVDPTKVLGDFYSCFAPNASLQEREIFYQRRLSLSQVVQIQTTATLSLVVTEIDQEIIAFPSKQVRECLIIDP